MTKSNISKEAWLRRLKADARRALHQAAASATRRERINAVVALLRLGWTEERIQEQVSLNDDIWAAAKREVKA